MSRSPSPPFPLRVPIQGLSAENLKLVLLYLVQEVAYKSADKEFGFSSHQRQEVFFTRLPQPAQNYPITYTVGTGEVAGFCHRVIEAFTQLEY